VSIHPHHLAGTPTPRPATLARIAVWTCAIAALALGVLGAQPGPVLDAEPAIADSSRAALKRCRDTDTGGAGIFRRARARRLLPHRPAPRPPLLRRPGQSRLALPRAPLDLEHFRVRCLRDHDLVRFAHGS
jgi:hypothetical protein